MEDTPMQDTPSSHALTFGEKYRMVRVPAAAGATEATMNCISTDGNFKFDIDARVKFDRRNWLVKHRYTEKFDRNVVAEIPRYVIWHEATGQLATVSEIVLIPR